jgi:hypothetical protein
MSSTATTTLDFGNSGLLLSFSFSLSVSGNYLADLSLRRPKAIVPRLPPAEKKVSGLFFSWTLNRRSDHQADQEKSPDTFSSPAIQSRFCRTSIVGPL